MTPERIVAMAGDGVKTPWRLAKNLGIDQTSGAPVAVNRVAIYTGSYARLYNGRRASGGGVCSIWDRASLAIGVGKAMNDGLPDRYRPRPFERGS